MAEPALTEDELRHYRARLMAGVAKLQRRLGRDVRDDAADEELPEHSQVLDDGDQATRQTLRDLRLRLDERGAILAEAMEAALDRLARGTFGICIDCGETIERARLDVEPWTPRCRVDQERFEQRQGLHPPTL